MQKLSHKGSDEEAVSGGHWGDSGLFPGGKLGLKGGKGKKRPCQEGFTTSLRTTNKKRGHDQIKQLKRETGNWSWLMEKA